MNNTDNVIKILVVYHKRTPMIKSNVFLPIQVGRANTDVIIEEMIGDDTGDNISAKNPNYCELTAQYWAWKNLNADYVGLNHYRRLFNFCGGICGKSYFQQIDDGIIKKYGWDDARIIEIVKGYDVITLPADKLKVTIYEHYKAYHRENDLKVALQVIKEKYPSMSQLAHDVIMNHKKMRFNNMILMKKKYFDSYSAWLFDILFEVERRIEISEDKQEARVFGYLAERLLNVYVEYLLEREDVRYRELEWAFGDFDNTVRNKWHKKIKSFIKKNLAL